MNDPQRQQLKDRIEAAEARNEARQQGSFLEEAGEKAIEAKDKVTEFAREHPVATVAGALAVGILIAGLFPSARRQARATGGKAAGLAAIAGELALAYGMQAMGAANDAGRAGLEKFDDLSDSVGDRARSLKRTAGYRAGGMTDAARIARRDAGKAISRAFTRT